VKETRISGVTPVSSDAGLDWRRQVFGQYVLERRAARVPGYTLEVGSDITRHLPQGQDDEVLLWLARFPKSAANRRIDEELASIRSRGWQAEWKLHDFDEPDDLKRRLEARGLSCHHIEALMVLDVAMTRPRTFDESTVEVKKASNDEIDEIATVGEVVWNCRLPWLARTLREMTDPILGSASLYCARTEDRVVGSGWIEFHGGSRFAQLCGGALLEEYRGQGIYSRLFEARVAEARARAVPYIAVDAAPMSRPILERRGFRFVCHTYPMRTRPYELLSA
jgi:GNAT superfamily N-acetyltransferase